MRESLTATNLANHLACRHLTELDRAVADGRLARPVWVDPLTALLRERGLAHEQAFVEHLRRDRDVVDLSAAGSGDTAATLAALRAGAGAVTQAPLTQDGWSGRADVLLRVEEPSELGAWSYQVVDTKLGQETRGGTVLQLCLYTDMLARLQGRVPEHMHVVRPGTDFAPETFRYVDYRAYYALVRRGLVAALAGPPRDDTYPHPIEHCEICRWRLVCDRKRHQDDHLSLVAGIRALHVQELERQGVGTLEQYATEEAPLRDGPRRGSIRTYARIHGQACVQLDGRRRGEPVFELLPPEVGRGLQRLPEPSAGDVFLDLESDPFVEGGGLEYLLGWATREGEGWRYRSVWAMDRAAERDAFETLMDFLLSNWTRHAGMHVYHYTPYEPAALKRLAGRHGSREAELDRLLRGERFVDLHAVTRQGVRASVERYTLKDLEVFHGFARVVRLPDAGVSLRRVCAALERSLAAAIRSEDRDVVAGYNRDDCLSTASLRGWLERLRASLAARGAALDRPVHTMGEPSDRVQKDAAATQVIYQALVGPLAQAQEDWGEDDRARWLLAHQLDYFRRELACAWWEHFRIRELEPEDLLEERKAVAGLEHQGEVGRAGAGPVQRYTYPAQEVSLEAGDRLLDMGGREVGEVESVDPGARVLDIRTRGGASLDAVMVNEVIYPSPIDTSHHELARSVLRTGVDGPGPYRAARDLLLRRPPRRWSGEGGRLRAPGEDLVAAAIRLAADLDHGVLPIQGPPGTGKTHAGARMILSLALAGKRVGVTAVSHKVIRRLLAEVARAAREQGVTAPLYHKVGRGEVEAQHGITDVETNPHALGAIRGGSVVGGTAWLWSRDDAAQALDYLFVDEAGQMALAPTLAAARAAESLVLLGDPQQLEQPQRGSHPEGSEVAALVHILGGSKTIRDDAGLFLDTTWRMHPAVCAFISEMYYEGRLKTLPGLERQRVRGARSLSLPEAGLAYVPVAHDNNPASSMEEVAAVRKVVDALLSPGATWTDRNGVPRGTEPGDLLVVAPYNAQVGALAAALPPGVRVGTVDRFQGQEAPVVIYSMASSSAQDAPRGMSFLYSPNRLNVAVSRAQALCVLVASPRVLEPECASPEHMRWANGLCRYRELSVEVSV